MLTCHQSGANLTPMPAARSTRVYWMISIRDACHFTEDSMIEARPGLRGHCAAQYYCTVQLDHACGSQFITADVPNSFSVFPPSPPAAVLPVSTNPIVILYSCSASMPGFPAGITEAPLREIGGLFPSEVWWRDRYHDIEASGYRLRPRYHPGWQPSWKESGQDFFTTEDGQATIVCIMLCLILQYQP